MDRNYNIEIRTNKSKYKIYYSQIVEKKNMVGIKHRKFSVDMTEEGFRGAISHNCGKIPPDTHGS